MDINIHIRKKTKQDIVSRLETIQQDIVNGINKGVDWELNKI